MAQPVLAVDVSGSVIGTTPQAVGANYPKVMAANLAALPVTSPSYIAHTHYLSREHSDTCLRDPSGRVQTCYMWETLYHEFMTSKGCRYNTVAKVEECAATSTIVYGVKHKEGILGPLGDAMTLWQLGVWLWEGHNWCLANGMTCAQIFGSGMCEVEDYACTSGAQLQDATMIDVGVDDNLPIEEGKGELDLSLADGDIVPLYDAPYGYGPWGLMYESADCMTPAVGFCL